MTAGTMRVREALPRELGRTRGALGVVPPRLGLVAPLVLASVLSCTAPVQPPYRDRVVPEALGETPIFGAEFFSCHGEYELTQDCKTFANKSTRRTISIGDSPISIAGSSDGKVVVLTTGFTRREMTARSLTYSSAAAAAFRAVEQELSRAGVRISRARAILAGASILADQNPIVAYALELDRDGYTHLKGLTVTR